MLAAASNSIPVWLYVICAMGAGGLLVFFGAGAAWWRQWRSHEQRVKRTCDAVLGQEVAPILGRYERVPGLIEIVPEIQNAVGRPNGKTIMEHITDIEKHLGMGDKV